MEHVCLFSDQRQAIKDRLNMPKILKKVTVMVVFMTFMTGLFTSVMSYFARSSGQGSFSGELMRKGQLTQRKAIFLIFLEGSTRLNKV